MLNNIFNQHLKRVIINLKQIYNDSKELNFLFLFLYKKYFGSACEFSCILNPKLIIQMIVIGTEHSSWILLLLGFFPQIIYIYIYCYIPSLVSE